MKITKRCYNNFIWRGTKHFHKDCEEEDPAHTPHHFAGHNSSRACILGCISMKDAVAILNCGRASWDYLSSPRRQALCKVRPTLFSCHFLLCELDTVSGPCFICFDVFVFVFPPVRALEQVLFVQLIAVR